MSKNNNSFEDSLKELESISKALESNDITLDKAIELFEKGIKLSKECECKLSDVKQKIERITESVGEQ